MIPIILIVGGCFTVLAALIDMDKPYTDVLLAIGVNAIMVGVLAGFAYVVEAIVS